MPGRQADVDVVAAHHCHGLPASSA